MNISIDRIQEKDFGSLISLFKEFATFQNASERMKNTEERMGIDKKHFDGFIIRNENGDILGYTIFFFAYFTWTGKALYMDDLYIKEEYRGKGLGKLLIDRVKAHAKETDCYKLHWQVSDWNHPAREFYKSLGADIDNVERNCDLIIE